MALPDIGKLNEYFDAYLKSLHHQSSSKLILTKAVNLVRSFFSDNPYKGPNADNYKKSRIVFLKNEFEETRKLPRDKAIISWRRQLDILDHDFNLVFEAETINISKYGFALKAISLEICRAMKDELRAEVQDLNNQLALINKMIDEAKDTGNEPISNHITERNVLLFKLIKLGDKTAARRAAELGLLDKYLKPDPKEFTLPQSANTHVLPEAKINPNIPWIFQDVFRYRLEKHEFPATLAALEAWDKEQEQKIIDAANKAAADLAAAQKAALEEAAKVAAEEAATKAAKEAAANAPKESETKVTNETVAKTAEETAAQPTAAASSSYATISQQLPELTKNMQPQNTPQEAKESVEVQQKKTRTSSRKKASQQQEETRDWSPSATM
ncbi:MAG: hypothetical protein P4M12_01900 [Gammaproteobacteria bacterium]|nr:hypothetical protein [Gammaproteobacteria bacterium]